MWDQEIRTNSKRGVGALKLRNCHRANVAEPDLWDLWALQLGPAAVHSLIIHSVKELGEYFKLGFEWIF